MVKHGNATSLLPAHVNGKSGNTTSSLPITFLAFSPRDPDIIAVASHTDSWSPSTLQHAGKATGIEGVQVGHLAGSREWRAQQQQPQITSSTSNLTSVQRELAGEVQSVDGVNPDLAIGNRPRVTLWNIKSMCHSDVSSDGFN